MKQNIQIKQSQLQLAHFGFSFIIYTIIFILLFIFDFTLPYPISISYYKKAMDNSPFKSNEIDKLDFSFEECSDLDRRIQQFTEPHSTERADEELIDCSQFPTTLEQMSYQPQSQHRNDLSSSHKCHPEVQNPHRIIRKGYLQRNTTSFLNRWQICYCVLTISKLYCFEDDSRNALKSCVNFSSLACILSRQEFHLHIKLQEYDGPIILKAYTHSQAAGWAYDIGSIIEHHKTSGKLRFMDSKRDIYHQKDAITERQFLQEAESGDIVLMSTTDAQCALQRFVTNSEYDHVGMVVRFNGEVKIFQANADEGVNVYNWAQFQSQFHQYEKISVRKLHYHRREELQPQLMNFIKANIGKKYDLRAFKLMRRKSSEDDTRCGYFCSELVAKVYKILGLLSPQKPSSNYWPVDFTVRGAINLLDSASLGDERPIMLQKHLKCS